MKKGILLSKNLTDIERLKIESMLDLHFVNQSCKANENRDEDIVNLPYVVKSRCALIVLLGMHFDLKMKPKDKMILVDSPYLIKEKAS